MEQSPQPRARRSRRPDALPARWVVRHEIGRVPGARIYEGVDSLLGDRRILVCQLEKFSSADALAAWGEIDRLQTATLLSVIGDSESPCAVFLCRADAANLMSVGGLSRAQRAALLVELGNLIGLGEPDGLPARVITPHTLWVEGLPERAELRAIPIPFRPENSPREEAAAERRAFARLALKQLFGIRGDMPVDRALVRTPLALEVLLRPLLSDDPEVVLAARATAAEFARALALSGAPASEPVPLAVRPRAMVDTSTMAKAFGRITSKEMMATFVLLLPLLLVAAPFQGDVSVPDRPHFVAAEAEEPPAVRARLVPSPRFNTVPNHTHAASAEHAMFFESARFTGPIPEMYGPLDGVPQGPHMRVFFQGEDLERVESWSSGTRLESYREYRFEDGFLTSVQHSASTGRQISFTQYWSDSPQTGASSTRLRSGAFEPPGCAALEFTWDEQGRITTRRCWDEERSPIPFPLGHFVEHFVHSETGTVVMYFDADERPVEVPGGFVALEAEYDERGRIASRTYLDVDGDPVVNSLVGASRHAWSRNDDTSTTVESLFGPDGPVEGAAGWHAMHRIDRFEPRYTWESFRTVDDTPAPQNGTLVSTIQTRDRGSYVETQFENGRGGAVPNEHGVTRIEAIEDSHGIVLRECHFRLGNRYASPALEGAHCVLQATNELGEVTERRFFGTDQLGTLSRHSRAHLVRFHRTGLRGLITRRDYLAGNEMRLAPEGYASVTHSYDAAGNPVTTRYLDLNSDPTALGHSEASERATFDSAGRETRRCFAGLYQAPVSLVPDTPAGIDAADSVGCLEWDYSEPGLVMADYATTEGARAGPARVDARTEQCLLADPEEAPCFGWSRWRGEE